VGHDVVVAVRADVVESLRAKLAVVLPHLDERQQRLVLAGEARSLGHGGIAAVAQASGASRSRISQGVAELEAGQAPLGRVRRAGGGRKPLTATDPALLAALLALVEPTRRGDPCSPLCWTTLSTRRLAAELSSAGHRVGADTVARLLREQGFSLQANAKTLEGGQHPDRDAQFGYLNDQAQAHLSTGDPVISVDTKKKELVGPYRNGGAEWRPAGQPEQVKVHDFIDPALGKANPYGVYDLAADTGWVSVGTDHDTAAFAVETIRRWWASTGPTCYPQASRLLITADGGGSNGYRTRLWKTELAAHRHRPAHHRVPPTARHLEMEQD
jgi:transposase